MKKAIVTGANGFLGSNLVKRLVSDRWEVHTITRRHISADIEGLGVKNHLVKHNQYACISEIVASVNPEVIYHLAAFVITEHKTEDILPLLDSNIIFGTYLLEGLKECKIKKFVNAGTFWQHYDNKAYSAVNLYAASKQAFQALIDFYVESYSIKTITLRLFDNYGPGDLRNKLFTQLLKASNTGNHIDMTKGDQYVNLVYVDDVIESLLAAYNLISTPRFNGHKHYKVCSSEEIKLKELVELYQKLLGKRININWGAKPYRNREIFMTPSFGEPLPGWSSKVSLEEGIKLLLLSNQDE